MQALPETIRQTSSGRPGIFCFVLLCLLPTAQVMAGEKDTVPWNRTPLLERFDGDANGKLDVGEQSRLHAAFDGLDVPWLAPALTDYTTLKLPSHWKDVATQTDSTPADNALNNRVATLGRVLFYDRQLSRNNTVACASCHEQRHGFADPSQFSRGFQAGHTERNSMGLANLRFTALRGSSAGFFWDERARTLEEQALAPIQDAVEMGMQLPELETKLQKLPYYPPLFEWAFGSSEVTSDRIAKSIAQFVRTLASVDSRFDQAAALAGNWTDDFESFSDEENHGKRLFLEGPDAIVEASCAVCHQPPTFHLPVAFNIGLESEYRDHGLGRWNDEPNDRFTPTNSGKFRAPSLKNVALTAPYMHDGRFATLDQVLDHYSTGIKEHENLGVLIRDVDEEGRAGFHFSPREKKALIAFLHTLTDESLIRDPRFADPFLRQTPPRNE